MILLAAGLWASWGTGRLEFLQVHDPGAAADVDRFGATYPALWKALERISAGCSGDEKTALFSGTAARVYRLTI